jgi:hypothetical protein
VVLQFSYLFHLSFRVDRQESVSVWTKRTRRCVRFVFPESLSAVSAVDGFRAQFTGVISPRRSF